MAPLVNGYKIANDVLNEVSSVLLEPVVNTTLGTGVSPGVNTVTPGSMASIYPGAQLIVGVVGTLAATITVTATTTTTFTASFPAFFLANAPLVGATFPVNQTSNPFFTQTEMLQYLSDAQNDYLTACPLILASTTQAFTSGQATGTIPVDAIQIERIANEGVALYEQGQQSLDWLNYQWTAQGYGPPQSWYEDRVNFGAFGVQPQTGNAWTAEILYAQRDSALLGLGDGFLLPDPFLTYVKYHVLAQCFGKDGEMRDPARARYCEQRYQLGVKIGRKLYENAMQPEVVNG